VTPRVRIAIVDSGVHASHPHVGGVSGGVSFEDGSAPSADFVDRLGHGTAIAAVIREKAPAAELWAVKVFDQELRTDLAKLLAGLDWAVERRFPLVNLSLGTAEPAHEAALRLRIESAVTAGVLVVTAIAGEDGTTYLPGTLPGVLPVELDWLCPRDEARLATRPDGRRVARASGYPRPIPGVPAERNLKGLSFAVANVTGCLARSLGSEEHLAAEAALARLAQDD
jgi:subtilisin family serine protease